MAAARPELDMGKTLTRSTQHGLQRRGVQHAVQPGVELLRRRASQALLGPIGQWTEAASKQTSEGVALGLGLALLPTLLPSGRVSIPKGPRNVINKT